MKPAVSAQRMHKDILPSVTLEHYPYLFLKDPPKLSFTNSLLYIKVSRRLSQKFVWQLWPLNHLKQISFFRLFCRLCRGPLLLNQSILQRQRSITANMDEDWPLIIQFVQRSSGFAPQIGQNPFSISDPLSKNSDAHLRRQRRAINGVNLRSSWLARSVQLLSTTIAITTITSFYSYSYMTVKLYQHHTAFCPVCYTGFKPAHNHKSTVFWSRIWQNTTLSTQVDLFIYPSVRLTRASSILP